MTLRLIGNRAYQFCSDFVQLVITQLKITAFFSYFEIKKTSAGNGLGLAWMLLEPMLRISIYVFVFTVVFQIRLPGDDAGTFSYAVYILMGLVPWIYISAVLTDGAGLVHSYAGFIRQPRFPYKILPNVILVKHLPAHLVGMAVLLVMIIISGDFDKINFPLLILVYMLMVLTVRGSATFLGACAAVLPDVRYLVGIVLMLAIYLSPVLYVPEMLGKWLFVGLLNPFSYVLTSFKFAMTGDVSYTMLGPWVDFSILCVLASIAMIVERWTLKRIRHTGIDRVV